LADRTKRTIPDVLAPLLAQTRGARREMEAATLAAGGVNRNRRFVSFGAGQMICETQPSGKEQD